MSSSESESCQSPTSKEDASGVALDEATKTLRAILDKSLAPIKSRYNETVERLDREHKEALSQARTDYKEQLETLFALYREAVRFAVEQDRTASGAAREEPLDVPKYRHNCERCLFLGGFVGDIGDRYDLYHCTSTLGFSTIVARFGSRDKDWIAGLEYGKEPRSGSQRSALGEAYRRARDRGLKV